VAVTIGVVVAAFVILTAFGNTLPAKPVSSPKAAKAPEPAHVLASKATPTPSVVSASLNEQAIAIFLPVANRIYSYTTKATPMRPWTQEFDLRRLTMRCMPDMSSLAVQVQRLACSIDRSTAGIQDHSQ
jgi:hypothetical protein